MKTILYGSNLIATAKAAPSMPKHGVAAAKRYARLANYGIARQSPADLVEVITSHLQCYARGVGRWTITTGGYTCQIKDDGCAYYSLEGVPLVRITPAHKDLPVRAQIGLGPRRSEPGQTILRAVNVISAAFGARALVYINGGRVWALWMAFDGIMCEPLDYNEQIISYGQLLSTTDGASHEGN